MKKKCKLLTLTTLCFTSSAFALPSIYPTEDTLTLLHRVKNETSSNLVADNVNPRKVFVMPPNSAHSLVEKKLFMKTANLGFCKEMGNLQKYSAKMTEEMADYEKKGKIKQAEIAAINIKLSYARQDLAAFAVQEKIEELADLDTRIFELETLIKEKTEEMKDASDEQRTALEHQIDTHLEELQLNTVRRRALARIHTASLRTYEKKKKSVLGFEEDARTVSRLWASIDSDLEMLRSRFIGLYKELGALEGGRAGMKFTSNWGSNIDKLRSENPGVDFEKMETQRAVFTTDIPNLSHVPSGAAVMSYKLSVCDAVAGKCETSAYPESSSGTVVLSNIGACPIEHPEYFDLKTDPSNQVEDMRFGMTVAYEYPTAMTVKATAKYNMYKMYQKIAKSGKSGGLFRSRSWSSVEEKTFFKDSFNVEWLVQDPGVSLTEAQKTDMEQEMRNNIFARLAKIGLPAVADAGALIAPTVPKSGAAVLGAELSNNKACRANGYCMAAAIGFSVLDAIFGSSSTSASYTNVQDVDMKDEWSSTSVVYKPYITSYINE